MQQDSYLTFGGLPNFLKEQKLEWICHRIAGDFHWQIKLMNISYGEKEIDINGSALMLTDTGTTLTYLLDKTFDQVVSQICKNKVCFTPNFDSGSIVLQNCQLDQLEPIWF